MIFQVKSNIYYGEGASLKTGQIARELGGHNLFIITEKHLLNNQTINELIENLKLEGFLVHIYDDMAGEPASADIEKALDVFKAGSYDLIVAIGGGSRIDSAKVIAMLATNPGKLSDYEGIGKAKNPKIPIIAVNTTAGTGADISAGAVITDSVTHRKMIIAGPMLSPEAAIGDPRLTISLPKNMTAFTGIDAFTHAVEGFVAKKARPVTDILACQAIEIIYNNLLQACAVPDDMDARMNMLLGQLLGGMVISHTSTGLVHAMARPFGVYFNQPHGLCNALFLPYATKYSIKGDEEKYREVLRRMSAAPGNNVTRQVSTLLKDFCTQLDVPSIADLGIDRDSYMKKTEQMAKDAIASGSVANNPTQPSQEEIIQIYTMAYYQDLGLF